MYSDLPPISQNPSGTSSTALLSRSIHAFVTVKQLIEQSLRPEISKNELQLCISYRGATDANQVFDEMKEWNKNVIPLYSDRLSGQERSEVSGSS